jgi:hypothetical protein
MNESSVSADGAEREAFEKWGVAQNIRKDGCWLMTEPTIAWLWEAWQARAALAAQQEQPAQPVAWRVNGETDGLPWTYFEQKPKWHAANGFEVEPLFTRPQPAQASTAPSGWKLVPADPTQEMVDAWAEANVTLPDGVSDEEANRIICGQCWRAMLAASSSSPTPAGSAAPAQAKSTVGVPERLTSPDSTRNSNVGKSKP